MDEGEGGGCWNGNQGEGSGCWSAALPQCTMGATKENPMDELDEGHGWGDIKSCCEGPCNGCCSGGEAYGCGEGNGFEGDSGAGSGAGWEPQRREVRVGPV